jgi:hypothetical protein
MVRLMSLVGLVLLLPASLAAAEPPLVEKFLTDGRLSEGERAIEAHLKMHPADSQARFGLGTLQFLRAVEHLGQSLYKYGAIGPESRLGRQIPIVRLAVPQNSKPAKVRYENVRAILQDLVDDLAKAEATLAKVEDPGVKLPLHFGLIALDLNGDGATGGDETLWKLYAGLNRGLRLADDATPEAVQDFVIGFDQGDVFWLRGYCHLLSAICETVLAYDEERFFNAIAHQLFDRPEVSALPAELLRDERNGWEHDIADAIVAIHLASFPLKQPDKMKAAHEHLIAVIRLSRESWKAIQTETDNDHEWVPNSKQESVIPNVRVSAEMIAGWHDFLNEAESMLTGKKLIPHWRLKDGVGINLRKVFQEPRDFDLVFWAHGAGAVPYVEAGEVVTQETFSRFERLYRGNFVGFAIWFN